MTDRCEPQLSEVPSYFRSNLSQYEGKQAHAGLYQEIKLPKYSKSPSGKKIPKGFRTINAPIPALKNLQSELVSALEEYGVGVHPAAHAYRRSRSICTMARQHVGKKHVIRVDLKDFFPSVTREDVLNALPPNVPRKLRDMISNWCFLDGVLPQGAPSSPLLSNIALYGLDLDMQRLADSWRFAGVAKPGTYPQNLTRFYPITYTRYCDDLVFSSDYRYMTHIIPKIKALVSKRGFTVNPKKIIHTTYSGRQYVTGVVVNEKMSAPRGLRRWLRSDMHRIAMDAYFGRAQKMHKIDENGQEVPLNQDKPEYPFDVYKGQVAHVKHINTEQGEKLEALLNIMIEVHTLEQDQWSDATSEYVRKRKDTTK